MVSRVQEGLSSWLQVFNRFLKFVSLIRMRGKPLPDLIVFALLMKEVGDAAQLVDLQRGLAGVALLAPALALLVGLAPDLLGLLRITIRKMGLPTFRGLSAL